MVMVSPARRPYWSSPILNLRRGRAWGTPNEQRREVGPQTPIVRIVAIGQGGILHTQEAEGLADPFLITELLEPMT